MGGGNAARSELSPRELQHVQEVLQEMQGREVEFEVTAVVQHEDMIVAEVVLPDDIPCAHDLPHLVLWRSSSVQPTFAFDLLATPPDNAKQLLQQPLCLQGVIALQTQSGAPTEMVGRHLKVEIHPRPSRQTEPKGHATFLDETEAASWKAALAGSVKQAGVGPAAWKLKANVQAEGRPGHLYLRWSAAAAETTAAEIIAVLEERLMELMQAS